MIDEYAEAAVQRLLTEHAGLAEQGITVILRERTMVLYGEVESTARRDEIVRLVEENFPDIPLHVDIGITRATPPSEAEDLL
ncbi:hypothetical protein GCM10022251_51590 [Phytohabitans flavus]|uniref:BON domain-containing protein n=1 Tax=Phytohabitans flavus TaxID=1076124 RepID=A0A6F8Y722_9ACTN|nr:hypothetical protein [Phytohabitans flavus]BCB81895.1 hypothetical protein Pflav_083050 [Phytohabitans flavus]